VRVPGDYAWEQAKRFGVEDSMDEFQKKKYGLKIEWLRSIQRFTIRNADVVIVPSRSFSVIVKRWIKNESKVKAIYNGIDLLKIEKATTGVSMKAKTIISAGRLVYNKGFEMLIRSMVKLPDWSLKIAGDGPEQVKLEKLIKTLGLKDRVHLLGRLNRDDLIRRIASSEIFVLNSYFETFSYQIVEAMSSGVAVVATDVGSLQEILTNNENSILFKPDSEIEFLSAVKKIDEDVNFRNKLIIAGKRRARDFSIEFTVKEVKNLILSLVQNPVTSAFKRRAKWSKLVRYVFSGGLAAFTNILLLFILTDIVHMWYLISSILSFLVAFIVSFVLQKFFTFQDHTTNGLHGQAFVYLIVTGTNLLINTGLIYMFVEFAHIHYIPAQILTSILIAIESYVIYGMFIFNRQPVNTKTN